MESGIIWIIGIVGFIIYRIYKNNQRKEAVEKIQKTITDIGEFQAKVEEEEVDFEGKKLKVYNVKVKGFLVPSHITNCPNNAMITTYVLDSTDGTELFKSSWPFITSFDGWAEEGSTVFQNPPRVFNQFGADSYYQDWSSVATIPVGVLSNPCKGKRNIEFLVYLTDNLAKFKAGLLINQESLINSTSAFKIIEYDELGYRDARENRPRVVELSIQLALKVASMDSNIDQKEIDEVKKWISKHVEIENYNNEELQKEEKLKFGEYLRDATNYAEKNTISQIDITKELNEKATKQQKYEALELMLDVMTSDDEASSEEMSIIDDIVELLQLDTETYKDLRESRLSKVEKIDSDQKTDESIFGIDNAMDNNTICEKLAEEYDVWSERLALPDKNASQRAKEMCDKIIQLRKKYKCS